MELALAQRDRGSICVVPFAMDLPQAINLCGV